MKPVLAALGLGIVLVGCNNSQTSDSQSATADSTVVDTAALPLPKKIR
jgi:hypothetical protein